MKVNYIYYTPFGILPISITASQNNSVNKPETKKQEFIHLLGDLPDREKLMLQNFQTKNLKDIPVS